MANETKTPTQLKAYEATRQQQAAAEQWWTLRLPSERRAQWPTKRLPDCEVGWYALTGGERDMITRELVNHDMPMCGCRKCPRCNGDGGFHHIEARNFWIPCQGCDGTGRDPQDCAKHADGEGKPVDAVRVSMPEVA